MKIHPQSAKNFYNFQSYLQNIHDVSVYRQFKYRTLQYDVNSLKSESEFEPMMQLISLCLSRSNGYTTRTVFHEEFWQIKKSIIKYYCDYPDVGGCLFADGFSDPYVRQNLVWLGHPSVEYVTGRRLLDYLLILWKRVDSIVTFNLFYGTVPLTIAYGTIDSPLRFIEPTLASALCGDLSAYESYSPFTYKYNDWFEIIEPTVKDALTVTEELASNHIYRNVEETILPFFDYDAPQKEVSLTTPISTFAFIRIKQLSSKIVKLPKYLPLFYPSFSSINLVRNTENFLTIYSRMEPSVLHKSVTLLNVFSHINQEDFKYLDRCVKATIKTYSNYLANSRRGSIVASKALDMMLRNYPESDIMPTLVELKLAE